MMTACGGEKATGGCSVWIGCCRKWDQSVHGEEATVTGHIAWLEPSVVSFSNTGMTDSEQKCLCYLYREFISFYINSVPEVIYVLQPSTCLGEECRFSLQYCLLHRFFNTAVFWGHITIAPSSCLNHNEIALYWHCQLSFCASECWIRWVGFHCAKYKTKTNSL